MSHFNVTWAIHQMWWVVMVVVSTFCISVCLILTSSYINIATLNTLADHWLTPQKAPPAQPVSHHPSFIGPPTPNAWRLHLKSRIQILNQLQVLMNPYARYYVCSHNLNILFYSSRILRGSPLFSLSYRPLPLLLLPLFLLFTTSPLTARVTFTAVILLLNSHCLQHTQRSVNSIWAKTTKPITRVVDEAALWPSVKNWWHQSIQ